MEITPEDIMAYDKHCNREQAERLARQINQK